ncbi:lipopolysaccharide export system permease protein [Chitinophaga skermanii]|uniref:Lipopolysaccharide export system permease protein n=1 Tax=Chitinophaga skermanii TaxID=331697 RepID=A0A327QJ19_9BACT|nr:LptF/LptG family permease [Chitinophaga skermanii]RAJ04261.1 lipopolysaccharide export system permease protein [Chitinophaga skermanii]
MKKLDKLIIKTFFGPFVATFFVTLFVLMMQFLWKYIDDLVGKGLETGVIITLLTYTSASLVPLALPLAVLLSSIMTFGNLGESFELVALKSAGISLLRFISPLLVVCSIIAFLAFNFANYVIPVANLKAKMLLYEITKTKPAFNIKQGTFYNDIPGYTIKVSKKDNDNRTIHNVMVFDRDPNGAVRSNGDRVILAKKGIMTLSPDKKYLYFILEDGWRYEERFTPTGTGGELIRLHFKKYTKAFDLTSFALNRLDVNMFSSLNQMLNIRQLDKSIDSTKRTQDSLVKNVHAYVTSRYPFYRWNDTGWAKTAPPVAKDIKSYFDLVAPERRSMVLERAEQQMNDVFNNLKYTAEDYDGKTGNIRSAKVEWQRKFTLSFSCIVMFMVGAPLGSIIRKGGLGMPLVLAVIFFVIFNVFFMVGEKMSRSGVLATWSGMWLSNAILIPIAVFLVYKALNDSQLFNKEFYFRFFQKIKKAIIKKKTLAEN